MPKSAELIHRRRWWRWPCSAWPSSSCPSTTRSSTSRCRRCVPRARARPSQLQWIVDAYTLVFASLLLTCGILGDRFGRRGAADRRPRHLRLPLGALRRSPARAHLIGARASWASGGALIMPATLSIMTNVFTDPQERAKAIGALGRRVRTRHRHRPARRRLPARALLVGLGVPGQPAVVARGDPRGALLVPDSRDPSAPRLDLFGTCCPPPASSPCSSRSSRRRAAAGRPRGSRRVHLRSRSRSPSWRGSGAPITRCSTCASSRTRGSRPRRCRSRSCSSRCSGSIFFLTQYLQFVLGYGALEAGVRVLPSPLRDDVGAARAGAHRAASAPRRSSPPVSPSSPPAWLLFLASPSDARLRAGVGGRSCVVGVGMGLAMAPATDSIMGVAAPEKAGVGSAINDTTRQVGGALGVAILGSVPSSTTAATSPAPSPSWTARPRLAAHDRLQDSIGLAVADAARAGGQLAMHADASFVVGHARSLRDGMSSPSPARCRPPVPAGAGRARARAGPRWTATWHSRLAAATPSPRATSRCRGTGTWPLRPRSS